MKLKLFSIAALTLALFTTGAFAADVSGKWTAETKTQNGDTRKQTFDLKQDGSKLMGTVSAQNGETPISEGKVDGDNVSFVVKMERNGNEMKMNYTGKMVGDELQLKVETPRGTREITAKSHPPSL